MEAESIAAIVLAVVGWVVMYFAFVYRTTKRLDNLEKHVFGQQQKIVSEPEQATDKSEAES